MLARRAARTEGPASSSALCPNRSCVCSTGGFSLAWNPHRIASSRAVVQNVAERAVADAQIHHDGLAGAPEGLTHGRAYLWGRDRHGRFRTRGRNAVATVRGTVWKTADSCAGTRV